tara:strand:- start:6 stop:569 length:564 start_codon:yes stop_codon:yes gene_type:complete
MIDPSNTIKSMRFFPDWNPDTGIQVCGLIELMNDIAHMKKVDFLRCVEIGSHQGESALIISSFPFINSLTCVEHLEIKGIKKRLAHKVKTNRVQLIFNKSEQYIKEVEDNSLDMVYIDAEHDYQTVERDLKSWDKKVKPGGFICGHDYNPEWPGVVRAVDEFSFAHQIMPKKYIDSSFLMQKQQDIK